MPKSIIGKFWSIIDLSLNSMSVRAISFKPQKVCTMMGVLYVQTDFHVTPSSGLPCGYYKQLLLHFQKTCLTLMFLSDLFCKCSAL